MAFNIRGLGFRVVLGAKHQEGGLRALGWDLRDDRVSGAHAGTVRESGYPNHQPQPYLENSSPETDGDRSPDFMPYILHGLGFMIT